MAALLSRHDALSALDRSILGPLESLEARQKDTEAALTVKYNVTNLLTESGAVCDGASAASADDLLLLNVRGTHVSVRRKHLTSIEGSLLALLFGGQWDGRLVRDEDSRVFIDMDGEAFKAIHRAILDAETLRRAGKAVAVGHLLDDAARGSSDDFWIRLMTAHIDKGPAESKEAFVEPQLSATGIPAELGELVKTVDAFVKAYAAENAQLQGQLEAAKIQYEWLEREIKAVTPFLKPLGGDDAVRSVEVCGQTVTTTKWTLNQMGDITLRHRLDLWSRTRAVEVVQPDHIGRMVDHYRRKRLGAPTEDIDAPLKMTRTIEQAAFDVNAAMYGIVKTDIGATTQAPAHTSVGGVPPSVSPWGWLKGRWWLVALVCVGILVVMMGAAVDTNSGAAVCRQAVSQPAAVGQGPADVFVRLPSGVFYRVVRPGRGPKPTRDQSVKYDHIMWYDDFDGQDKSGEGRGREYLVSNCPEWAQEMITDMPVGELRWVSVPAGMSVTGQEKYIEYRLYVEFRLLIIL
ncbi:unnamed protein product [Vitrella brassicaformis CCMP3155]|uniref:Potassium channel tetramerisation-type BTB domain-containing protein n=1 Tax=Vitrella brassicaformis (strain CCMP3155) TaxID=1169540 RepID=A0A0G4GPN0_VITBC|nr:unnamed protein product [Vitrella brassicaformis CCMP3155]|eukprot:CEM32303.1 unnamed protein product [Vitrella brassicaformis CCMP3155]